jgi:hypothetical protein
LNRSAIFDKIKERESKTNEAVKMMSSFTNNSKDTYQRRLEGGPNIFDNHNDAILDRAKKSAGKRDYIVSNILSKMLTANESKVDSYYDKYVK